MAPENDIARLLTSAPIVMCPGCLVEMTLRDLQPASVPKLYAATYRCPKCGTDTEREFASPQTERALIAVQQTALRERLQRDVVTSSSKAFDLSATRMREGTIDQVTLLSIQQTMFQAHDALAQAQFDRLNAIVALFQALGGGWNKPAEDAPPKLANRP